MKSLKPTLITFRGYIAVVRPHRALRHGEMAAFVNAVNAMIGSEYRRIIIDLKEVDVDSTGLGVLVTCYARARCAGAFIGLMGLTGRVRHLAIITKLVTVFPLIRDDVFPPSAPPQRFPDPTSPPTIPLPAKPASGIKRAA